MRQGRGHYFTWSERHNVPTITIPTMTRLCNCSGHLLCIHSRNICNMGGTLPLWQGILQLFWIYKASLIWKNLTCRWCAYDVANLVASNRNYGFIRYFSPYFIWIFPTVTFMSKTIMAEFLQKMLLYQYFVKHATKIQIKQTKSISDANDSRAMPVYSLLWTIFFNMLERNLIKM